MDASNAAYSPSGATVAYSEVGVSPVIATHQQTPFESAGIDAAVVPAPPSPSVGGKPGRSRALGWSTGLRSIRHLHQRFSGRTLVVPSMGAHPVEGSVGFSNRLGRLNAGVNALYSDYTPSPETVAEMFRGSPNPLVNEMRFNGD